MAQRRESPLTPPHSGGDSAAGGLRIGLISDTHGLLRREVFEIFSGVDRIVHAGDVGDPDILIELGAIAPVTAVWGNVDHDLRSKLPETARIELGGISIGVIHGQQFGSPTPSRVVAALPGAGLVVFGHSHRPLIEKVGQTLAVNPGSAGPKRFSLPVTVAIAVIEAGKLTAELVPIESA